MNLLQDIITYIRRIVKTPANASLTDNLIIDYINRFWIMDVDARVQLFDLKTKYQFETIPGIAEYNMPLYSVQIEPGSQTIDFYPVYQGFMAPASTNGIQIPFYTQRDSFWRAFPNYIQPLKNVAIGDGLTTTFQFNLPFFPAIPGHVDMTGIIANGSTQDPFFAPTSPSQAFPLNGTGNIDIPTTSMFPGVFITYTNANGSNSLFTDSGVFLDGGINQDLYGLMMQPGNPPFGNLPMGGNVYSTLINTVNYTTGVVNITFPTPPPAQAQIQAQCYFYQQGMPVAVLFHNNTLSLRPPPDTQYLMEFEAYLSPAAFLVTSNAIPFAYMAEYLARGAARKILSDTGDIEQFQFYEPLFREQETLVWKRSQRIITSSRTNTIFSDLSGQSPTRSGAI